MKRRSFIAAIAAIPAIPALAQRRFGGGPNRLEFLAGYLGLTDSQKAQAKTILDAAAAASETARGEMMSARETLRDAIKAGKTDTELDQLAAAVGTIEGRLLGIQSKASAKIYALLTTEQKAKYDEMGDVGGPPPGGGPPR